MNFLNILVYQELSETSTSSEVDAVAAATAVLNSPPPMTSISYSEEDLKSIKELFPTFDEDVIKSILDLNRGNKEATIEALLQMN